MGLEKTTNRSQRSVTPPKTAKLAVNGRTIAQSTTQGAKTIPIGFKIV